MPYNPLLHTLTAKAIGFSQANPGDARSFFYDEVNEVYRHYVSVAEALAYLDFPEYRTGNFPVWINATGTLNPDGTITGGEEVQFMFLGGTGDANLVELSAGGVKQFPTAAAFPNPGKPGLIYIATGDDSQYYWNGTAYKQITSVRYYPGAAFPAPGNAGYLYIAKDTGSQFYWNGTAYVMLTGGPGSYIQNQQAVVQTANFRISGRGEAGELSASGPNVSLTLKRISNSNNPVLEIYNGTGPLAAKIGDQGVLNCAKINVGDATAYPVYPLQITGSAAGLPNVPYGFAFGWNKSSGRGESNLVWCSQAGDSRHLEIGYFDGTTYKKIAEFSPAGVLSLTDLLSLAAMPTDPGAVNGSLFFRSDTGRVRVALSGVWQNLVAESGLINGKTLHVDGANPNATDARAGISPYNYSVPFRTINAAAQVAGPADVVYVHAGTYAENVVSASQFLNLVLGPLVLIQGTVSAEARLIIIGDYPITRDDTFGNNEYVEPYVPSYSRIISNSATPTVYGGFSGVNPSSITGVHIENTGAGDAVNVARVLVIEHCRVLSGAGFAIAFHLGFRTGRVNDCFVKSTGNTGVAGALSVTNSTVISTGAAPNGVAIGSASWVENCRLYSANTVAITFNSPGPVICRNNLSNSFGIMFNYANGVAGVNDTVEITGNTINVRDAAEPNAFAVLVQQGMTSPAFIADNKFNKAGFSVVINALTGALPNITANNAPSLPFGPTTPRIGGVLSAT